jgi:hypothetical protein
MATRYRWYRVQLPSAKMELNKIFSDSPFTKDSTSGFSCIDGEFGLPIYRYLWRTKMLITRFDDDGRPSYEEVASVSFTDFSIISVNDLKFLRVENPGRNIRDLLNKLESIIGLGFTCKPVTFEKGHPKTLLKSVEAVKLVGLRVIGAVVANDVVARMDLASKQGIIIDELNILKDIRYKVDSSSFELVFQGVRGSVVLSSGGLIKISGQLAPKLISLIEQDLPGLI